MARACIIAISETGFTRAYAEWIAQATGAELTEGFSSLPSLDQGDVLVIGAPVHGGELLKARDVRRALASSPATSICFACGLTPADDTYATRVRKASGIDESVPFHYFVGGFAKDRLPSASRVALALYKMMANHQRTTASNAEILLERTSHDGDYTDRSLIGPLVDEVKAHLEGAE